MKSLREKVREKQKSTGKIFYYALSQLLDDPTTFIIPWAIARLITKTVATSARALSMARGLSLLGRTPQFARTAGLMVTEAFAFELTGRLTQSLTTRERPNWDSSEIARGTLAMSMKFGLAHAMTKNLSKVLRTGGVGRLLKDQRNVVLSTGSELLSRPGRWIEFFLN